jgi:hypothetical protein
MKPQGFKLCCFGTCSKGTHGTRIKGTSLSAQRRSESWGVNTLYIPVCTACDYGLDVLAPSVLGNLAGRAVGTCGEPQLLSSTLIQVRP